MLIGKRVRFTDVHYSFTGIVTEHDASDDMVSILPDCPLRADDLMPDGTFPAFVEECIIIEHSEKSDLFLDNPETWDMIDCLEETTINE